MTYELAKKLKDAGFPQNFRNGNYYAEKDLTFKEAQVAHFFFDERQKGTPEKELATKKCISIPTLSELIEAIGDNINIFKTNNRCVASLGEPEWGSKGENPEEAVANLWLELNKQKNG